jgi:uncharacterized cupin superfamily protein
MNAHDIRATLVGLPEMEFHQLAPFNGGHVGVFRCSAGISPWERHPEDEELLHVIEGEVDIEVLTDDGPRLKRVRAGSVFVVPRGLWHRHRVPAKLQELYLTPGPTESSSADDPRAVENHPAVDEGSRHGG